jgi:hypothetical protein
VAAIESTLLKPRTGIATMQTLPLAFMAILFLLLKPSSEPLVSFADFA